MATSFNTPKKSVQRLIITLIFFFIILLLLPILKDFGYKTNDDTISELVYEWRRSLQLESLEDINKLPTGLLSAVMHQESAGDPHAESHVGAKGLFQFMPGTARDMGLTDRTEPQSSALAAAKYLKKLYARYNKNIELTLAAYNWGLGNVDNYLKRQGKDNKNDFERYRLTRIPNETQNYIARVKLLQTTYYLR